MAHEKQGWKEVLQAAKPERSRSDDRIDQAAKKKLASIHYKRRKLDKDVKRYIKDTYYHRSTEIEQIGRRHGFRLEESPFREDPTSHENA